MQHVESMVDLGFASAKVPPGSHVCQIYGDDADRDNALLRFLTSGLRENEATACFSENLVLPKLETWFEQEGFSFDGEIAAGRFSHSGAESVYFQDNYFDPERMLRLLAAFHKNAADTGRAGARVIGEMSPAITKIEGGSRLFEYEARVNQLLCTHPVTAVCQYDARLFDGATIMDVLSVHPMMVVRGQVVQNPFFEPAEAYTSR